MTFHTHLHLRQQLQTLLAQPGADEAAVAPALTGMNLIVESHECLLPGITKLLIGRFAATHDITSVQDNGPAPWLVMKARKGQA